MFWNKSRRDARVARAMERERRHFEHELRRILQNRRLTLALARMTREKQFTFKNEMGGGPDTEILRRPRSALEFFGVVHEESGRAEWQKLGKWIHATLMVGGRMQSPNLGWATFSARAASRDDEVPAHRLNRQLSFEVVIGDDQDEIQTALVDALRDKAISGDPFIHVEIELAQLDADGALRELVEGKGYVETQVRSLSLVHEITLHRASTWAWKWSL